MFGKNPKRPSIISDGNSIFVQEIFPTIQGEGIFSGLPAIFVRLGGCNLACSFCDTEFENFQEMQILDILNDIKKIKSIYSNINLIVITGGEPLRQNILKLFQLLDKNGYKIQIETNGTLYQDVPDFVSIMASPKCINGKYTNIHPDLMSKVSALKFLISQNLLGYDAIPDFVFDLKIPIFLQPMDELTHDKNNANNELTVKLSMQYGFRISIQTHKILNIR